MKFLFPHFLPRACLSKLRCLSPFLPLQCQTSAVSKAERGLTIGTFWNIAHDGKNIRCQPTSKTRFGINNDQVR